MARRLWCTDCQAYTEPAEVEPDAPADAVQFCGRCGECFMCGDCGFDVDGTGRCLREDMHLGECPGLLARKEPS